MVKQEKKVHKKEKEARLLDSSKLLKGSRCCCLIRLLALINKALNDGVHICRTVFKRKKAIVQPGEGKHRNDLHLLALMSAQEADKIVIAVAAGTSGGLGSTNTKAQWATWPWARITCHLHCRVLVSPKCEDHAAANEIVAKTHIP